MTIKKTAKPEALEELEAIEKMVKEAGAETLKEFFEGPQGAAPGEADGGE